MALETDVDNSPEIFIGLVGAAGTDLKKVFQSFRRALKGVDYKTKEIHLSKLLEKYSKNPDLAADGHEDLRIVELQKTGDDLREKLGRGDAVAVLGLSEIFDWRSNNKINGQEFIPRTSYIFTSLKHPDEVKKLRSVYGDGFFVISVHTPRTERIRNLSARIAKTYTKLDPTVFTQKAEKIIDDDYKSSGDFSQNVMDTFPLADFFIDSTVDIDKQITRFIELLFGNPFVTPTLDEYGMFFAKAAAFRSADLSRQVGAAIITAAGEVVSTGCNEVPEAGGGHAWYGAVGPLHDNRDFRVGHDANSVMKHEIVTEIFERLISAGWLNTEKSSLSAHDLMKSSLYDESSSPLKGTKVTNIIEFGRIIHAEMSAITDASRRGVATKGATLFCTTFPCHMCARHIIAAGIIRAVYIEPYEKSATKSLYGQQIQFEITGPSQDKVLFHPFIGVSPTIYAKLFEMPARKDKETGQVLVWDGDAASVRISSSYKTYLKLEASLLKIVLDKMLEVGLIE